MVQRKADKEKPEEWTGDVEQQDVELSEDVVTNFDSFEQALSFFQNRTGVVNVGDVAGDGYVLTRDKEVLLNIPLLLIDWKELEDPETQRRYASMRIITSDGRKFRINDGSTGIFQQLKQIRDKYNLTTGIAVPKGFFKSEYFIDDETRKIIPPDKVDGWSKPKSKAATYYLNQSS